MGTYKLLISTVSSREEAHTIAKALVSERLAACVNIAGEVESVYRWNGDVEKAQEFMMLIKTTGDRFGAVMERLKELHSYEVPELIQVPIENGLPEYLEWISESVAE
jgi:periplasmic divalent cation tolerance protein